MDWLRLEANVSEPAPGKLRSAVAHFGRPGCSIQLTPGGKFVQSDWFPSLVMLLGDPAERLQAFGRIPRGTSGTRERGRLPRPPLTLKSSRRAQPGSRFRLLASHAPHRLKPGGI